jgi:glycolate oxidase
MPLTDQVHAVLRTIFAPGDILTAPEDLAAYAFDGTAAMRGEAEAVVFARTTDQVSALLREAMTLGFAVVTRGAGTGLSGGSLPSPGAVVLCTARMDHILEVDAANLVMRVEPGVSTAEIAKAAAAAGLFYPPDPGSMRVSTIGGNVAENSGGLRGLKYGVTRNYVMGLTVVLPGGDVLKTGNACVKDVAGYSLKDLFIGSEGTLGVITEVLLRLIPKPAAKRTLVATYDSMEAAAQTVSDIIAARIIPCTLEFLDNVTIRCVEAHAKIGLPLDCAALLLMETDGHPAQVAEEADAMAHWARKNGCLELRTAADDAEAERLAGARRAAFSALARVAPTTILEDATVPRSELARMVSFIAETARRHELKIGVFGHMGDGNLHPTFLTDERDHAQMARVHAAFREIFAEAIRLGGTITGEHGVGVAKKEFLPEFAGTTGMRVMRAFRAAMDPAGSLNPGKMFDADR